MQFMTCGTWLNFRKHGRFICNFWKLQHLSTETYSPQKRGPDTTVRTELTKGKLQLSVFPKNITQGFIWLSKQLLLRRRGHGLGKERPEPCITTYSYASPEGSVRGSPISNIQSNQMYSTLKPLWHISTLADFWLALILPIFHVPGCSHQLALSDRWVFIAIQHLDANGFCPFFSFFSRLYCCLITAPKAQTHILLLYCSCTTTDVTTGSKDLHPYRNIVVSLVSNLHPFSWWGQSIWSFKGTSK